MARIFKRSDKWYVDYTYKGKRYRQSVGKDKKTADLIIKDIEIKIAKGEYLGITGQSQILFEDFTSEYLDYAKVNKAHSTYNADCDRLNANLLPYFSRRCLHEIHNSMIEEFKNMRISKVKGATVNRDLALLKHIYTKAIDWGYVTSNPVKKVKFFKESQGRTRFLNNQEIASLHNECSGILKSLVMTALYTGMRRGEILKLKWQDVDIINRIITVTFTKNNQVRNIPIANVLFDELMQLPRHSEYVFSNPDGSIYKPRKRFETALRRAKLSGVCWYTLRHTFASILVMNGTDLRTVAELLGDKTLQMVMRYSHLSRNHLRDAIGKLDINLVEKGTNLAQPANSFLEKCGKLLNNNTEG